MRHLLLIWILLVPFAIYASGTPTLEDKNDCQLQARFAATALQSASGGVTLSEQLTRWDEFTRNSIDDISKLILFRTVISRTWKLHKKFPSLTPNEYGDYVYAECLMEKLSKPRIKF